LSVALLLSSICFSQATVSVSASATASLDPETRRLLESLPIEIREQMEKFIADVEPKIKADVVAFSNLIVQERALQMLDDAARDAKAVERHFADWLVTRSSIKDVDSKWGNVKWKFGDTSSPAAVEGEYLQFLERARIGFCDVRGQPAPTSHILGLIREANWRADLWHRVRAFCAQVDECYEPLRSHVQDVVKAANQRDLTATKAGSRLQSVSPPQGLGVIEKLWKAFDIDPYEQSYRNLLRIEADLLSAREDRESISNRPWRRMKFSSDWRGIADRINSECSPSDADAILASVTSYGYYHGYDYEINR